MDFYSGKQPNLIGPLMKSTIYKVIKKPQIAGNTISDKVSNGLSSLYKTYIVDNKLVVFIIIIIMVFLIYRYYQTKSISKSKSLIKKQEEFLNQDRNLINDIKDYQTNRLMLDIHHTMNPIESLENQKGEINYPSQRMPINIPNKGLTFGSDSDTNQKPFSSLNRVNYDYNNINSSPLKSYYSGTPNQMNWFNNFNTSQGNFVNEMTFDNRKILTDYQTILNNNNNNQENLIDSLKLQPNYIGINSTEYTMQSPFAIN